MELLRLALALLTPSVAAQLTDQGWQAVLDQLPQTLRSLGAQSAMLHSTQACPLPAASHR